MLGEREPLRYDLGGGVGCAPGAAVMLMPPRRGRHGKGRKRSRAAGSGGQGTEGTGGVARCRGGPCAGRTGPVGPCFLVDPERRAGLGVWTPSPHRFSSVDWKWVQPDFGHLSRRKRVGVS